MSRFQEELAEFKRVVRVKQIQRAPAESLGPAMLAFFKQSVEKKQTKFGKVSECWSMLVPAMMNDHCALESFTRGSLTVFVDSSSHLYELKQLLLSGLEKQLLLACKSHGLRKITLKIGQWYEGDSPRDRKIRFD